MGEIADAMLNGEMCEWCGIYLEGEPPGYPQLCSDCQQDELDDEDRKKYGL
jgi:hypothetical protein